MELVDGLGLRLLLGLLRSVGLGRRLGVLDAKGLSVPCTSNYSSLFPFECRRRKRDRCERELMIDIAHRNHTHVPPHSKQTLDTMHSSKDGPKQKKS
jgi:hypothetical protein